MMSKNSFKIEYRLIKNVILVPLLQKLLQINLKSLKVNVAVLAIKLIIYQKDSIGILWIIQ